jgi:hypothetical protein
MAIQMRKFRHFRARLLRTTMVRSVSLPQLRHPPNTLPKPPRSAQGAFSASPRPIPAGDHKTRVQRAVEAFYRRQRRR